MLPKCQQRNYTISKKWMPYRNNKTTTYKLRFLNQNHKMGLLDKPDALEHWQQKLTLFHYDNNTTILISKLWYDEFKTTIVLLQYKGLKTTVFSFKQQNNVIFIFKLSIGKLHVQYFHAELQLLFTKKTMILECKSQNWESWIIRDALEH